MQAGHAQPAPIIWGYTCHIYKTNAVVLGTPCNNFEFLYTLVGFDKGELLNGGAPTCTNIRVTCYTAVHQPSLIIRVTCYTAVHQPAPIVKVI